MECIWHYIFYKELKIAPEEHPVLLTEPTFTPRANREKATQIMFETFNVPAYYAFNSGALSIYSEGKTNGVALEFGDGTTNVVPMCNGNVLTNGLVKINFDGASLTNYMSNQLALSDLDIAREIKERLCYIAIDLNKELINVQELKYELPDGNVITVGNQRIYTAEAVFTPSLMNIECMGIHLAIYTSIIRCDIDFWQELFNGIILGGGGTMFAGITARLEKELDILLQKLYKSSTKKYNYKITAPAHRKYSAWLGGSVLAKLSSFQQLWISKEEYDESGPTMNIGRKCF